MTTIMENIIKEKTHRPLLISIFCVIGFVTMGLSILGFLFNPIVKKISEQFGVFYLPITIIITLASIISLVGYWKMKKWGVYSYVVVSLISFIFGFIMTKGQGASLIVGSIFPVIIVVIGLINLNKME